MKYVLLIWNECPEEVKFYLIPEETARPYRDYLVQAHNKLINCDDSNDGMKFLNTALSADTPEKGFENFLGMFRQHKQDATQPIVDKTIVSVYYSGFYL